MQVTYKDNYASELGEVYCWGTGDGDGGGYGWGCGLGSTGGSCNAEDYNIWGGDRSYVKDCGWSVSYSGGSGNGMGDGFGSGGDE